jgi:hypothetical protein
MDFNKVNEANKAGENTPAASNINTDKQVIPPVEDGVDKQPANTVGFRDESLDEPYTEKRTITINLVTNYSLYRRVNDKTLSIKNICFIIIFCNFLTTSKFSFTFNINRLPIYT